MKQIQNYNAEKYNRSEYELVEDGIYKTSEGIDTVYVTSLSFVQEPKLGEGNDASDISQYPLEDILDKFNCYVEDFYSDLNKKGSKICYHEFASIDLNDIKELRSIIGKHVYNKENGDYVDLIIDDYSKKRGFTYAIKKFFSKS